jgi:cytochrome c
MRPGPGRRITVLAALVAAVLVGSASAARAEGDAAAGEKAFQSCSACHAVQPGRTLVGPSLHGVVGRTPGTLEKYRYSGAMVAFGEAGEVWDEATLDTYLTNPRAVVKGTRMVFPGVKDNAQRSNIIAYLKSLR